MKIQKITSTLVVATMLAGCATMTDTQKVVFGALGGAVAGGVIGHQVDHKNGRYVGAVLGALAGGAIAHYMTQQQQDLEKVLASSGITVTRVDKGTIKLNLPNDITFAVDKSRLNSNVYGSLTSIANIVNKYNKTAVHINGFTDSTGSASYNQGLSERRAKSVANYLASRGVVAGRLVTRGYGENYPIASNSTVHGKAQNRRAEIYIRAIQQGQEHIAYAPIY
ncbi:OmpA family protein [Phocoenobacter skyensis]|uniref:OmpA family protein n=1 Tax=Phocoenobacter skyensis TaxID=97481 RepID=A0A1H7Z3G2_9PAST|nr:OmpA family protein [Pasteurella skyensis]MDP8080169.1 OmpA family protein [Pasteurella skyensis]MDP8086139.1 OmpA family protein [Pasteurella skyensis]MDP8171123.1 OmpA family protein [Pasteurella skyensis]MDP8175203.1 OmpA family protein [Pasteurella skyensis]MDP8185887.1 OmpA family protein [Pasteurella skyensis]